MEMLKTLVALIATLCFGIAVILIIEAASLGSHGKSLFVPALILIVGAAFVVLPELLLIKGKPANKVLLIASRTFGVVLLGYGLLLMLAVIGSGLV